MTKICTLIAAAGTGVRMNSGTPKQYLELAGIPVITRSINRLRAVAAVTSTVVALDASDDRWSAMAESNDSSVYRVVGGKTRAESVLAGLKFISQEFGKDTWVLVHDAARPLVKTCDIQLLIETVVNSDMCGGLLATRVTDTLKKVNDSQVVCNTLDRNETWQAQTPQMFRAAELGSAIEQGLATGFKLTDESSAMEICGKSPIIVEGSPDNIKITYTSDLAIAEVLLAAQGDSGAGDMGEGQS